MRHLGKLVALTVAALALVAPAVAQADPGVNTGLVDGRITLGNPTEVDCSWTNGTYTGGPPPTTLTINRSSINPPGGNVSCTGADSVTLNNDPVVVFNDANGTATVDKVNTTGTRFGVACTYEATNVGLTRDGTTRHYTGSFIATRVSGSIFVCPSTSPGTADILFH
jgi:hypothetical protein